VREQAWAPKYADDALRAAELDAARARQEAVLEEDPAAAEKLWAEHEARAEVARAMEEQAAARDAWARETAAMRAVGERAETEIERRHLPAEGEEPDRVTAQEWLEAHRAADVAEDPHRVWADTDEEAEARTADLAAGVEARADEDVASAELPAPRTEPGRARERQELHPDAAVLEALSWEAEAVHARVEDRTSLEKASAEAAVVEPYDVADGYYVPAPRVREEALVQE
jgi:hypothetical protein